MADTFIKSCVEVDWSLVACPGGMPGAENLRDNAELKNILLNQCSKSKLIGAICASPAVILSSHNILSGRRGTCYPAPKFIGIKFSYLYLKVCEFDFVLQRH